MTKTFAIPDLARQIGDDPERLARFREEPLPVVLELMGNPNVPAAHLGPLVAAIQNTLGLPVGGFPGDPGAADLFRKP